MNTKPSGFQRWVENRWYGKPGALSLLSPVSCAFAKFISRRRTQQKKLALPFGIPVVVVGNISIGGTGKTPTLIALSKVLQGEGYRVGVVSRGYGRVSNGLVTCFSDAVGSPGDLGDEAFLIRESTGCDIAVSENRVAAVQSLVNGGKCDIVLSDDGLQHYRMYRDKEIVVVDGQRFFGNQQLLPVGPLREGVERLDDVDWVLLNGFKNDVDLPEALKAAIPIAIKPMAFVNIATGNKVERSYFANQTNVHAIAGIGNPDKFFSTLRELSIQYEPHAFPDHHQYQDSDLRRFSDGPLLMTEKDAVKCRGMVGDNAFYLSIEMQLPDSFVRTFLASIDSLMNARNTIAF